MTVITVQKEDPTDTAASVVQDLRDRDRILFVLFTDRRKKNRGV
ncbi:MAG: hypothetical protein WC484_08040 [Candidatus Omnitrophota bacterium]